MNHTGTYFKKSNPVVRASSKRREAKIKHISGGVLMAAKRSKGPGLCPIISHVDAFRRAKAPKCALVEFLHFNSFTSPLTAGEPEVRVQDLDGATVL